MKRSDDVEFLRLRQAFAAPAASDEEPVSCPDPDRIWMAASGQLPARDTHDVVLHTAACAGCAEAWRLAHDASRDAPVDGGTQPAAPWRSVWVWGPGLAAAALLVIGVLADLPPRFTDRASSTQYRENGEDSIKPLVADGAVVSRDQVILRWEPGPPGSRYNVRVMTDDLTPIAAAWSIGPSEYQVPPASLAKLPSGARLLWQVDAIAPDHPRRTSPPRFIQLQ